MLDTSDTELMLGDVFRLLALAEEAVFVVVLCSLEIDPVEVMNDVFEDGRKCADSFVESWSSKTDIG